MKGLSPHYYGLAEEAPPSPACRSAPRPASSRQQVAVEPWRVPWPLTALVGVTRSPLP